MGSAERELPDGWIRKESRSRPNKFYFLDTKTGKTQWNLPASVENESNETKPRDNGSTKSTKFDVNSKGRSKPSEGQSRFKIDDKSKDRKCFH